MVSTSTTSGKTSFTVPKQKNVVTNPCSVPLAKIKNSVWYAACEAYKKKQQNEQDKKRRAAAQANQKAINNKKNSSSNSGDSVNNLDDAANEALSDIGSYDGSSDGSNGTGGSSGSVSPLLEGNMSFEELVGEICNGIDLVFLVKRSTIVITDYESLYAEAKYLRDKYHDSVKSEDIGLWRLADGSYELAIEDYGFYNTVKVNYKNGTVVESYTDLVRQFGEVAITYDEPSIDKTTAIMKAKAYLAAHVRDFNLTVKGSLLHDGDIDIGDIVTLENPMTLKDKIHENDGETPEFLFVSGNSISWEGGGPIMNDIELRFGPESPEKLEVPDTGASYSKTNSGNVESALAEVGQQWSGIKYSNACQTADCVKQTGGGDCWGCSDLLYTELTAKGIQARIMQYPTSSSSRHRSVQYYDNGEWKNFPYRQYGFNSLFNDTSGVNSGTQIK